MEGLDDDDGMWFVPEAVGQKKKKKQPAAFHARRGGGGDAGWNPASGGVGGPLRRAAAERAQATHEVTVHEACKARNRNMYCIERALPKSNVSPHSFLVLQRLLLQVAGLQVSFPFPPYPCQLTFMATAINALQVRHAIPLRPTYHRPTCTTPLARAWVRGQRAGCASGQIEFDRNTPSSLALTPSQPAPSNLAGLFIDRSAPAFQFSTARRKRPSGVSHGHRQDSLPALLGARVAADPGWPCSAKRRKRRPWQRLGSGGGALGPARKHAAAERVRP